MSSTDPEIDGERTWLEWVVVDACRLVSTADATVVRSVTVVGGRRLNGAEIRRVREQTTTTGIRLTMDGSGTITVCRAEPSPVSPPSPMLPGSDKGEAEGMMARLRTSRAPIASRQRPGRAPGARLATRSCQPEGGRA